MEKKEFTVVDNSELSPCWRCDGKGILGDEGSICPCCQGTGKWKETHFIVVDEKNKIAIDSDTGG